MASLPNTAIAIADLVTLWTDAMPELRDQAEADRMNELLGNLLRKMRDAGKEVPAQVFLADEPPTDERAALLASPEMIRPVWFSLAYARWHKSNLFKAFWKSLDDADKAAFFNEVPRGNDRRASARHQTGARY